MGRLLLLLLVIFLFAGGGVGTWWFGIRGEPIPGLSEFQGQSAEKTTQSFNNLPSEFVEMKPLSIPVMQEGQVTKLLTLVVSLEVAGNKGLTAVSNNRPQLRDAMLSELHGLYSLRFVRENDDSITLVKRRLGRVAKDILGNKWRGIYVQAVQGREVQNDS